MEVLGRLDHPGSPTPVAAVAAGRGTDAGDREWPDAKGDSGHPIAELKDSGLPKMFPLAPRGKTDEEVFA